MTFFIILQQISAVVIIILVLLHSAKADGIAGIGGQANVYGSSNVQREMEVGLDRITIGFSTAFILISLFIAWNI
jgi:preprotein translocase subunit SecG